MKKARRIRRLPESEAGKVPDGRAADLEIIEQLLKLALDAIAMKTPEARLADVLKLLEFKQQLKPEVDARKIFWEWIDRFRQEELARDTPLGPNSSLKEHSDEKA